MSICFLVIRGLSRDFPASIWDRSRTDSFSFPRSLRNPCFSVVFMPLLFNWYVVYSAVSQTFIKAIPLDPCLLLRKTFVSFSLEIQIQSCVFIIFMEQTLSCFSQWFYFPNWWFIVCKSHFSGTSICAVPWGSMKSLTLFYLIIWDWRQRYSATLFSTKLKCTENVD